MLQPNHAERTTVKSSPRKANAQNCYQITHVPFQGILGHLSGERTTRLIVVQPRPWWDRSGQNPQPCGLFHLAPHSYNPNRQKSSYCSRVDHLHSFLCLPAPYLSAVWKYVWDPAIQIALFGCRRKHCLDYDAEMLLPTRGRIHCKNHWVCFCLCCSTPVSGTAECLSYCKEIHVGICNKWFTL